jgi:hypothetical protein
MSLHARSLLTRRCAPVGGVVATLTQSLVMVPLEARPSRAV